jgi:hypothetical protein
MIGTGFVFLSPRYIITAKHVVEEDGLPKEDLAAIFLNLCGEYPLKVVFLHPELDIAILENSHIICKEPLNYTLKTLSESECFFTIGYKPSESNKTEGVMEVNQITNFKVEHRERSSEVEQSLVFEGDYLEGGHSGGPVFSDDGKVIALIIEGVSSGISGRATPIAPIVECFTYNVECGISLKV